MLLALGLIPPQACRLPVCPREDERGRGQGEERGNGTGWAEGGSVKRAGHVGRRRAVLQPQGEYLVGYAVTRQRLIRLSCVPEYTEGCLRRIIQYHGLCCHRGHGISG